MQGKVVKISQLWNGGCNGAYECDIEGSVSWLYKKEQKHDGVYCYDI